MSDDLHADLGAYVLGDLDADENARYEDHLSTCVRCRDELAPLRRVNEVLAHAGATGTGAGAGAPGPPADLGTRVVAAVERAAIAEELERMPTTRPAAPGTRRRRLMPVAAAFALVAALAGGVAIGSALDSRPEGAVEIETVLGEPGGGPSTAEVRVVAQGIGRVISFRSDDLPILPMGEYYELWFVGPGDTIDDPNRISAGTFHPDEDGRSVVEFTAAVDPAKYPVLSVTAEPGDGNPERTGPEVLRSDAGS